MFGMLLTWLSKLNLASIKNTLNIRTYQNLLEFFREFLTMIFAALKIENPFKNFEILFFVPNR